MRICRRLRAFRRWWRKKMRFWIFFIVPRGPNRRWQRLLPPAICLASLRKVTNFWLFWGKHLCDQTILFFFSIMNIVAEFWFLRFRLSRVLITYIKELEINYWANIECSLVVLECSVFFLATFVLFVFSNLCVILYQNPIDIVERRRSHGNVICQSRAWRWRHWLTSPKRCWNWGVE